MSNLKLNLHEENDNDFIKETEEEKRPKMFQNKTMNKVLMIAGISIAAILLISGIILAIPLNWK